MKPLLIATLCLAARPALAQNDYDALFAQNGPAAAARQLAAIAEPSASDRFALGAAHFLASIEGALQARYTYDLNSDVTSMASGLPFLRLPVDPNPAPEPFTPDVIPAIFADALIALDQATTQLTTIADDDDVAVTIRPANLWFDINSNGQRDPGEALLDLGTGPLVDAGPGLAADLSVRFDTADAAWLAAYAHMLSGMSEVILASDPATAVADVFAGAATIDALRGGQDLNLGFLSPGELPELDVLVAMVVAIEGPWDSDRTRAAHAHFKAGLAQNRVFWTRLARETDNTQEWIPNPRQQSVLPLQFPPDISTTWQAVLDDAEAVLDGDLLIPYWRMGDTGGINLARLMQDPPEVDLIGLFHGYTLAPYIEAGPVTTMDSLEAFDAATGGNAPVFAIVLN